MKACECENPNPWENNKGRKTNVCKTCSGKLPDPPTTVSVTKRSDPLGKLITAVQVGVAQIAFKSDEERDKYLTDLAESFPRRMEQNLLTWRSNRKLGANTDGTSASTEPANAGNPTGQTEAKTT